MKGMFNEFKKNPVLYIVLAVLCFLLIDIFAELIPFIIVGLIIAYAVSKGKEKDSKKPTTNKYPRNSRLDLNFTPSEKAKANVYLRKYFRYYRELNVSDNIVLKPLNGRYDSIPELEVYQRGVFVATLEEFGNKYPTTYDLICNEILKKSQEPLVINGEVIEDKEEKVEPKPEKKVEKKKEEKDAQYFIDEINGLNNNIEDKEVSEGLYETCSLLTQIDKLEEKFPESKDKVEKLYEYYLPILVKILMQFDNLQSAQTDPNYKPTKEKLTKNIKLINDAMRTIISSMTDRDFINLSADISTLEAVLKKDGLAGDDLMGLYKNYQDDGDDNDQA